MWRLGVNKEMSPLEKKISLIRYRYIFLLYPGLMEKIKD